MADWHDPHTDPGYGETWQTYHGPLRDLGFARVEAILRLADHRASEVAIA